MIAARAVKNSRYSTIVIGTSQNTSPMQKKNQLMSVGAKRTPAIGTMMLPTTGMNQAGLA